MVYDLSRALDMERFRKRVQLLTQRGAVVEFTEKCYKTNNQNNYAHLLMGVVAMDTGNTIEYVKEWYFKKLVNPAIFVVTVEDKLAGSVQQLRSIASLSKEEMSVAIDRFFRWGNENGFYMPAPGDDELLHQIQTEVDRMRQYL